MPVAEQSHRNAYDQRGYTLVELVIGIVVFGVALVLMSTTLFPMFAKSADPHYEARAAALGQAVMTDVLARQFDQNSDADGSRWRCDENAAAVRNKNILSPDPIPQCSRNLAGISHNNFVAVEDYIGCWGVKAACTQDYRGTLDGLVGGLASDFSGFTVDINVVYDATPFSGDATSEFLYKRVDVTVDTGRFGRYDFSAYRGNF
ncbi:type IV pilus modification PilV family protein [Enterovibrio nigricans]|uniref:MSHA pilin protein MshD n=1 Tax=Enterovibrio nigricans DSM 22720 TaxID=1121868 RepID=A0A1T4TWC6_9GAMM|nr:type II secretion system protein [Enterovibrio nigricans]PKF50817.1 type II secretion system protein [Enterovibrio nigricans]SKA44638.1 MSHA pilin protein MshD [Enterovibrio nigricans DSM 22720]